MVETLNRSLFSVLVLSLSRKFKYFSPRKKWLKWEISHFSNQRVDFAIEEGRKKKEIKKDLEMGPPGSFHLKQRRPKRKNTPFFCDIFGSERSAIFQKEMEKRRVGGPFWTHEKSSRTFFEKWLQSRKEVPQPCGNEWQSLREWWESRKEVPIHAGMLREFPSEKIHIFL